MSSQTGSMILKSFTEMTQNITLNQNKENQLDFQQSIKARAKRFKKQDAAASIDQAARMAEEVKEMKEHILSLPEFEAELKTNLKAGLSEGEAAARLEEQGPNRLSEKAKVFWGLRLIQEMTTPFALLLWAGAILSYVAYPLSGDASNLYLAIVITVIVIGTGLLTFYQTMKSESIMEGFKNFIPPETIVIRDGVEKKIEAVHLVRGDLVKIELGKKIPADIRIIECVEMKVDNSSLTGEPELLLRSTECTDKNPLETKNLAFSSTLNREGTGKGVVIATGDRTFIGRIANLAASAESEELSPLKKEIKRFIVRLTIFAVVIGVVLFCLGFAVGYPALLNFIFAIGVITANVPEGLIVEVTVGLTLTAKKLAEQKVLCKSLDAVETLGATSCICSDKTGTLTTNKMTGCHLWYSGRIAEAANRQKQGADYPYQYDVAERGFIALQETAVVCSVANFDRSLPQEQAGKINNDPTLNEREKEEKLQTLKFEWEERLKHMLYLDMPTTGDASETGLIKFFQPLGDITELRQRFPVVRDAENKECRMPFNSDLKYAVSINEYRTPTSHYCLYLKGAPEKIWKFCTHVDLDGNPVPKDGEWERKFTEANLLFGKNGERVLGFCKSHLPLSKYPKGFKFNAKDPKLLENLCFVGIFSLVDPPRDSVPEAVLKCRSAGIKVIMVTGDQPVTAASIAKQCNIITGETVNEIAEKTGRTFEEAFEESDSIVIHGDELTKMAIEDDGLPEAEQGKKLEKWLSKPQVVFARTTPPQKLIIVKACQKMGEVVAVTGDGVNDSPAINKADVGISMGITGTDVAKDSADMILLNDDFSSIVVGVEEGRKIYDNLKKSICYALTSQVCQMLPFIGFVIFQFPLPVTTVIVLYISIGTDLIPATAFAYEPGELDIMTRRPRSRMEHMVTMTLMAQAYGYIGWTEFWGAQFCYYVVANDFGFPPSQLQFKANIQILPYNQGDTYNPTSPTFGNTALSLTSCTSSVGMVDWIYTAHSFYDLRMTLLTCQMVGSTAVYTQQIAFGPCLVQQISPYTNLPVCYTTEGMKYAQSAYFYGTVIAQISNAFLCKTRKLSLLTQGVSNVFLTFALCTEVMLILIAGYFQPFNTAFGTRDNIFMHFGIPCIPFALLQLLIDEVRKYFLRNLPPDDKGVPHWFVRAAQW